MESIPQDMDVQKRIFKSSLGPPLLRYMALLFLIFCIGILPAYAGRILHYKTYHPNSGEISNRFRYTIEENLSGGYRVHWIIEEDGSKTQEDYTLDEHFETLRFRVVNVQDETDYTGERKGGTVFIHGRFKGKKVESATTIDERPFYYNPKLGLAEFARSGEKVKKFWGFQNRELKVYPMRVTNEGLEVISIGKRSVEAVKIYWTVDDFRSAFFKRTYWFRPSDGLYLKQKTEGGKFRELVSEEGGEDAQ